MEEIRLTQFSRGSGCGCKIAPAVLEEILQCNDAPYTIPELLVGNDSRDDAAVYDLGNDRALISTTDFFMPIVDDAYDFGRIAAANAISDVYAMGGKPILALAILGWPVGKLPNELARKVIDGAKAVCREAGIALAGGHSIDALEPVFGLSVNGLVPVKNLKKNNSAKTGDVLFLSKKIGTGILSTAEKRGVLKAEHKGIAIAQMCVLNKVGEELGEINAVHAMTDVTGFGLLGHLIEMADGSNCTARIQFSNVPVLAEAKEYAAQFIYPDNTMRNWSSYEKRTQGISGESLLLLCDPQTNGGLLIAVDEELESAFLKLPVAKHFSKIGAMENRDPEKSVFID